MRIKLSEKFQNEREDICNKIINILELDENNSFLLCELDNDTEKQNNILLMKEDIQKYFSVSCISSFTSSKKEEKVRQSVDFTEGKTSSHQNLE